MYYLPLSIDANESINKYYEISKYHLVFMWRNIYKAVTYQETDNPLTNWAKSNNMNMLHLVKFLHNAYYSYSIIQDNECFDTHSRVLDLLNMKNNGTIPKDGELVDGKITFTVNDIVITMASEDIKSKRDDFCVTMPIPVSSEKLKKNFVWYSRMYYYLLSNQEIGGGWMYSKRDWEDYVTEDDQAEFMNNVNELVNNYPELV